MEIMATNLKAINTNDEDLIKDGEKINNINYKDLGTSDIYPLVIIVLSLFIIRRLNIILSVMHFQLMMTMNIKFIEPKHLKI